MKIIDKFKKLMFPNWIVKYGKIAVILWVGSLLLIAPVIFILFGWQALVAYLICKFTGACPL